MPRIGYVYRVYENGRRVRMKRMPILHRSRILLLLLLLVMAVSCSSDPEERKNSSPNTSGVDRLALEVERAEAVRAVKNLQRAYAQYIQFGLWKEMTSLFSGQAQFIHGDKSIEGRKAIDGYFSTELGNGKEGLAEGELRTQLVVRPLVNVSADGQSAKARWWEISMFCRTGVGASWAMGIYENEYIREDGVWKISRMHYYPKIAGPYETGWRNVEADMKIVPYHFTPEETGIPVPEIPEGTAIPASGKKPDEHLSSLERRISVMNDEDGIRNLQSAYGYYIDRKMWDDVTDLFTEDGLLEIPDIGIYKGVTGIRRALERNGSPGLKHGQLNDHLQLDMMVSVDSNGVEAHARGLEFGMLGEADRGEAYMSLSVFENRYVKENDIWKIREMRIFPIRKTDYYLGWAKSNIIDSMPPEEFAPDQQAPASDHMAEGAVPAFLIPNPVTGKAVAYPPGASVVAVDRILPAFSADRATKPSVSPEDMDARIKEATRKLALSKAWDGTENVSSAYGDYLDDLDFPKLAELFAVNGSKQVPFTGFYVTRKSISNRPPSNSGEPRARTYISLHWLTQPVILVAEDGRSTNVRTRLFQPRSSRTRGEGFAGAMYSNQAILENGSWKLWSVAIDEHYFESPDYKGGWSAAKDPEPESIRKGSSSASYPPDIPLKDLGERLEGFIGGPGDPIIWPSILPMWFHYRNPVSGRTPAHYWPDCVTCIKYPDTSMKNHGYMLPPN